MWIQDEKQRKYPYDRISGLPDSLEWCYSAEGLQEELTRLTKDLVLEKLYVCLDDYLDRHGDNDTCLDLSFVGGYVLLVFDELAIAFALHVEGMVRYSIFQPSQMQTETRYDAHVPNWFNSSYKDLVELKTYFEEEYTGKRIQKVKVGHTNIWGFHLDSFDQERAGKAADASDLPDRVVFYLENGVRLSLVCDQLEYCYITVKKQP